MERPHSGSVYIQARGFPLSSVSVFINEFFNLCSIGNYPLARQSKLMYSINMDSTGQGMLFEEHSSEQWHPYPEWADNGIIAALHSEAGIDLAALPANARRLFELSINAFSAVVHARMSEFPIAAEIQYFEQKVLSAADSAGGTADAGSRFELEAMQRRAAEKAASDRGDPQTQTVLQAAYKAGHEIHRLTGLLRFSPDDQGVYIARCEPDHFILPAFASHFKARFGETPWAIIDRRRGLCLRCAAGGFPELCRISENRIPSAAQGEWENLWRHYHQTINNESRNNPDLQRSLMPKRYWKYLTEMQTE